MAKPLTKILPEKLKQKSHLIYKIQQKHEDWGIAKCAILIGAGCSHPTIPLGNELITICQYLCFIRDNFPKEAPQLEKTFLQNPELDSLSNFILKKSNKLKFDSYVSMHENDLLQQLKKYQRDELKKVPDDFTKPKWADFENYFWNDAKYGFWMNSYNNSPRERQRLIEALIENCNPSGAYIILALLIEKQLINNIITTNFDDFINDAVLNYTSSKPRFYANDELSQFITIHSPKPNIIKLHGDYRYANIKNTTKETLELSERMEEKLSDLLKNLDLIVIGYNGSDYSIMNVLQKVKTPSCELIWCDLDENNVHWRVANLINSSENSWFIKIKGFDDIIKDFYLEFVQTPPDLVSKAYERQEDLTRYVSEYNKVLQETESGEDKSILEKQENIWNLYKMAIFENDMNKKIELFTHAIKLNPDNPQILIDRGIAYKQNKDFQNALKDLNSAIELNPTLSNAFLNRGYILEENGKYHEAIKDFDEANKLGSPNLDKLYNNYAVAYRRLKDFQNALIYVQLGLKHNPEMYQLFGTLALIYSDMGEDEKFYDNIEICLNKGCPIGMYLDEDPGFDRFKNTPRFKQLLKKYNQTV